MAVYLSNIFMHRICNCDVMMVPFKEYESYKLTNAFL